MSLDMQIKHPRLNTVLTTLRDYAIYGILAAAAFLVIFGVINIIQNREQQTVLDKQLEDTNKVIAQTNNLISQVKKLSEENKKLSQTAANYAYCNATILAKYTQTNNPITVQDLEKCKFTSYPVTGSPTSFNNGQGGQTQSPGNTLTGANSSNTNSDIPSSNSSNGNNSNKGSGTKTPPVNNPPTAPPPNTPASTPLLALKTLLLPPISLYAPCSQVSKLFYIGKDAITVGCR